MGTITTSTGLISGINYSALIDQLIALKQRPVTTIEQRNAVMLAQQTAYQEINATVLSLSLSAGSLSDGSLFNKTTAFSSNESVLTISSGDGAVPGNYTLAVARLVGAQQTITRGFADSDAAAVAPGGAVMTFEAGRARLASQTPLNMLNGGAGVSRGSIRIADGSGATTVVDLSSAVTVDDVVDAINQAGAVNVIASITGDGLTLEDASGGAGSLTLSDVGTSGTATSLGVAGSDAGGVITGTQINRVGRDSVLAALNDGNGVGLTSGSTDFSITTAGGGAFNIDLGGAVTLGDVMDQVEDQTGGQVTAGVSADGVGLVLTDTTGGGAGFVVTAVSGSAAADLGLVGDDGDGDGQIGGQRLVAAINSRMVRFLNGGQGLAAFGGSTDAFLARSTPLADLLAGTGLTTTGDGLADLSFKARDSPDTAYEVDLDALTTVGDLIDAVGTATGGRVRLSVVGDKLRAADTTGGTDPLVIESVNGALAATELGLAVDAGVATTLSADLDPAGTVATGATLSVTNSAGGGGNVDLSGTHSVSQMLETINGAGLGVLATLNDAGNGVKLVDAAGGSGDLVVADVDGVIAEHLGLAGTHTDGTASGANLQFQYITEATRLDTLGVTAGQFRIRDSSGVSAVVDLTQGNEVTLGDVIGEINSRGLAINARINDTGDGILIEDQGPGTQAIEITEEGSSTASDLGLLTAASGSAGATSGGASGGASGGGDVDGSFEKVVAVASTDTLSDVARKITDAKVGVSASVINDGSVGAPYRLSLNSQDGGSTHAFSFDDGGAGFGATELARAQDAVVFYGSASAADALVITSTRNRLEDVIPGATIDLLATSDQPVQVTISEETDSLVDAAQTFASGFNTLVTTIDKYDSYDAENEVRGLLLGDSTVLTVRSRVYSAVIGANTALSSQFQSLSQVGFSIGPGARLEFDQEKFQNALETDPEAVEALLSFESFELDPDTGLETETVAAQGVMVEISKLLERLTSDDGGTITNAVGVLQQQIDLNNDRIETIEERIASERARLEAEFLGLEQVLAQLQDQSAALSQVAAIRAPNNSSSS